MSTATTASIRGSRRLRSNTVRRGDVTGRPLAITTSTSEGASTHEHACPGRHATRVRNRDFDRIARWKMEPVKTDGGPVGECGARRKAAPDRSEDEGRGLRHPCPGIEAGGDPPPAPATQLLSRQLGLQRFGHREWTVLELLWDDRVLRHQGRRCSSPRCKSTEPVKKAANRAKCRWYDLSRSADRYKCRHQALDGWCSLAPSRDFRQKRP